MPKLKLLSLLLLFEALGGCGYHWQPEAFQGERPTVHVPFVKGDEDGFLTAEVIRALSASGLVQVVSYGGTYELNLSILNSSVEKIGFRVDPQKVDGKVRKNLLACEGRKTMNVEVSLCREGETAYGPYQITADAEYDYVDGDSIQDLTFTTPTGQLITVLPFSLGQLEPLESAQEAARRPLYAHLARKVVESLAADLCIHPIID